MRFHHKSLFALIMAIMLIPPLVKVPIDYFDFAIMPLKGHIVYVEYPEFSWPGWFEGSYQKEYENYLEDHIGLRNFFVRVHNEIDFSLYRKPKNTGIIVGSDDYLYQMDYIDAYLGKTFIGHEAINNKCHKIKAIQDTLSTYGTELIVVLAPGKASMFPEHIPERLLKDSTGINNHDAYHAAFDEYGIKYIDFNTYFREIKDSSPYPLYHKAGIHWNTYGASLARDSIVRYMEDAKDIDMPDMSYEGIEMSALPRNTDYDVGDALNIFSRVHDQPMPYYYGHHYEVEGKARPNLMVIADSYYWTIYNLYGNNKLWNTHDFRYYNMQLFSQGNPDKELYAISVEAMTQFDFIMPLYTEMNLHVMANDFFEQAYALLFESERLEQIKTNIRNDSKWYQQIVDKANERGISEEEMLQKDALWLLIQELKKQTSNTNNE